MDQVVFEPTVTGTLKRVDIPRTGSWHTSLFWGFLSIRKFSIKVSSNVSYVLRKVDPRHLFGITPTPVIPWRVLPKGPQVWEFPPDAKAVNRVLEKGQERVYGQWTHKESGWVMTTISPPSDPNAIRRTVLYFHGSSFRDPITTWHWGFCGYLSRWLDAEVVVVPYPLGPNNPGPEWRSTLLGVYKEFVDRAGDKEIIVAGDSAGGMIALGLIYDVHAAKLRLPHQVVAISCPTDLALPERPAMLLFEPNDPLLTVEGAHLSMRIYAGVPVPPSIALEGEAHTIPIPTAIIENPGFSPKRGDHSVLRKAGTKVIIISAGWDVLFPETESYVNKLAEAAVDVTYIVGEKQVHIFPVMVGLTAEAKMGADMLVKAIPLHQIV